MREVCESLLAKANARGVIFVARDGSRIGSGAGQSDDIAGLLAATDDVEHQEFVHRATTDGLAVACSMTCGYLVVFFAELPDWRVGLALVKAVDGITRRFDDPRDGSNGDPGSGAPARR